MDTAKVNTLDGLNKLIKITAEGKDEYDKDLDKIEDPFLKEILQYYSAERNDYIIQLELEITSLHGIPKNDYDSPKGLLHNTWINIKSTLSRQSKNAILQKFISREKSARNNYKNLLEQEYITGTTRDLLNFQLAGVEKAIQTFRTYALGS